MYSSAITKQCISVRLPLNNYINTITINRFGLIAVIIKTILCFENPVFQDLIF